MLVQKCEFIPFQQSQCMGRKVLAKPKRAGQGPKISGPTDLSVHRAFWRELNSPEGWGVPGSSGKQVQMWGTGEMCKWQHTQPWPLGCDNRNVPAGSFCTFFWIFPAKQTNAATAAQPSTKQLSCHKAPSAGPSLNEHFGDLHIQLQLPTPAPPL